MTQCSGDEDAQRRRVWQGWPREFAALAIVVFVAYLSAFYLCTHGLEARGVWRRACTPAAMFALGRGYTNTSVERAPALRDFIAARSRSLDPAQVPADLPAADLDYYHWRWGGLLRLVGLYWRIFGISWGNLAHLFAAVSAATAVTVWLLFRVTLGFWPAAAGAALWLSSPVQLYQVANFRDYFKAFFLLTVLVVLAAAIRNRYRAWPLAAMALFTGSFIAAGLRFRDDIAVMLPLSLLVFAVFIPGAFRTTWRKRLIACAALCIAFAAASWGYLGGVREYGSHSPHNISMGLTQEFEERLGLGGAPYDLGPIWNDALTFSTINSYGQRNLGIQARYYTPSRNYDMMGGAFLKDVISTFPADRLLFAYASVVRNLNVLPFSQEEMYLDNPTQLPPLVLRLHEWRWRLLGWLYGLGVLIALAAILALAAADFRLGFAAACMFLYIGGYPSLQYDTRHAFYTEVLLWWAILLLLVLIPRAVSAFRRNTLPGKRGMAVRSAALAAALAAGLGLPLAGARAWQSETVRSLHQTLSDTTWTAVRTAAEPVMTRARFSGSVIFPVPDLGRGPSSSPPEDRYQAHSDYLAIDIGAHADDVPLRLEYVPDTAFVDFSREFVLRPTSADTTLYTPIYTVSEHGKPRSAFRGVVLRTEDQHVLRRIARLTDEHALRLWPTIISNENLDSVTHLLWQAPPRPWIQQRIMRNDENLLQNSGFESWASDTQPTQMTSPDPGFSLLLKVPSAARDGDWACQQHWLQPDGASALQTLFGVRLDNLHADTTYELTVAGNNQTGGPVRIVAAQMGMGSDGSTIIERLGFSVVELPPSGGQKEFGGYFHTTNPDRLGVYIVAMFVGKKPKGPMTWERWTLTECR